MSSTASPDQPTQDNQAMGGLAIFQNEHYLSDLNKLLVSKELDECYDYEANDKSYKALYDCLNIKQQRKQRELEMLEKAKDQRTSQVKKKKAIRKDFSYRRSKDFGVASPESNDRGPTEFQIKKQITQKQAQEPLPRSNTNESSIQNVSKVL